MHQASTKELTGRLRLWPYTPRDKLEFTTTIESHMMLQDMQKEAARSGQVRSMTATTRSPSGAPASHACKSEPHVPTACMTPGGTEERADLDGVTNTARTCHHDGGKA